MKNFNPLCPKKVSVIITTYNWPQALGMVLKALNAQTCKGFEVIVADDGSREDTEKMIKSLKDKITSYSLHHVWQEDEGFRVASIRNKAVMQAKGDYLIFMDGDCVPRTNFIERHCALAEPNFFVAGNRMMLEREFTIKAISEMLPIWEWSFWQWLGHWIKRDANRLLPLISFKTNYFRKCSLNSWKGAKGCNLSLWKADLLKLNGWEEQFQGWGYEDSDLVIRLIRAGIKRKEGRFFVPVIHLWHPINDRSNERNNMTLLQNCINSNRLCSEKGINQYGL